MQSFFPVHGDYIRAEPVSDKISHASHIMRKDSRKLIFVTPVLRVWLQTSDGQMGILELLGSSGVAQ